MEPTFLSFIYNRALALFEDAFGEPVLHDRKTRRCRLALEEEVIEVGAEDGIKFAKGFEARFARLAPQLHQLRVRTFIYLDVERIDLRFHLLALFVCARSACICLVDFCSVRDLRYAILPK